MKNLERRFGRTTEELLLILSSLDQEQLNRGPFTDSWTAGQIGDHLRRSYAVVEILNGRVKPTSRPRDEKVALFENLFLDLSVKMESPKEILPAVGSIDKEELINKLSNRILELTDVITGKELRLSAWIIPFRNMGNLPGSNGWLLIPSIPNGT